jgi:hypothetical protein
MIIAMLFRKQSTSAVSSLVNTEFIREEEEYFSSDFAGNDFPPHRFTYSLTDKGKRAVQALHAEKKEEFSRFSKLAKDILDLNDDYILLSYAAKVYCILEKSAGKERNIKGILEVSNSAKDFGWNLSAEQVREGAELLQKIVTSSFEDPKKGN